MEHVNRREFAGLATLLMGAIAGMGGQTAEAQAGDTSLAASQAGGSAAPHPLKELTSGVFKPQPGKGMQGGHESHAVPLRHAARPATSASRCTNPSSSRAPRMKPSAPTSTARSGWFSAAPPPSSSTAPSTPWKPATSASAAPATSTGSPTRATTDLAYFVVTVGPPE